MAVGAQSKANFDSPPPCDRMSSLDSSAIGSALEQNVSSGYNSAVTRTPKQTSNQRLPTASMEEFATTSHLQQTTIGSASPAPEEDPIAPQPYPAAGLSQANYSTISGVSSFDSRDGERRSHVSLERRLFDWIKNAVTIPRELNLTLIPGSFSAFRNGYTILC